MNKEILNISNILRLGTDDLQRLYHWFLIDECQKGKGQAVYNLIANVQKLDIQQMLKR